VNTERGSASIEECCSVGIEDIFHCMARHNVKYIIRGHQYQATADVKQKGQMRVVTIASSSYRRPNEDHISLVSFSPDKFLVHNISPRKNMYTAQIVTHCVIAKVTHSSLTDELQSLPGVTNVKAKGKVDVTDFIEIWTRADIISRV
jgi:hypothetical protein